MTRPGRDALRLLREKQAESCLQALRDLLAAGSSRGEAVFWNKDAFLQGMKARAPVKEIRLTPGDYGYRHFGMGQANMYTGRISTVSEVPGMRQAGTPRPELGEAFFALSVEQHFFIPAVTVLTVDRIASQPQASARHLSWR